MRYTLPLMLFLAACATPQERCVDRGTRELQTVQSEIARLQANLDRGYAIHRSREPYRHWGWCRDVNGHLFNCWETDFRWVETPVAIDPDLEQRKLDALKTRLPELTEEAEKNARSCKIQYPD